MRCISDHLDAAAEVLAEGLTRPGDATLEMPERIPAQNDNDGSDEEHQVEDVLELINSEMAPYFSFVPSLAPKGLYEKPGEDDDDSSMEIVA